jgi:tRNA-2-methylthio-N6-dimethylallyladenosine synthase
MNRNYTREKYLELVYKIKTEIPDIKLTTDIMVGFPGETEEDFNQTIDIVRQIKFNSAFTFIYSKRNGTLAAKMQNQIPKDVSNKRFQKLLLELKLNKNYLC